MREGKVEAKSIAQGMGWLSMSMAGSQAVRLFVKLILARLLLPQDYGLIGMAMIVLSFTEVFSELGMASALIQRKRNQLTPTHYYTAFWFNLGTSIICYGFMVGVLSPLAIRFFHEPLLGRLLPVMSLSLVINALFLIPKVRLTQKLQFKPQAIIEIAATGVSALVALLLAYLGAGVWALVANAISASVVMLIGYNVQAPWIPHWQINQTAFRELFSFGNKVMLERVFHFFTANADYLLIGKLLGSAALGVYTLGFVLTNTFTKQLLKIVNRVLYPVYSSKQDQPHLIAENYLLVTKITLLIITPVMFLLLFQAETIISFGFGKAWLEAVVPLQFLSVAVLINALGGSTSVIMRSVGRPDLTLRLSIFCALGSTIPLILLGAWLGGIAGAALGIVIDRLVRLVFYQEMLHRLVPIGWKMLLEKVLPVVGFSIVLHGGVYFLTSEISGAELTKLLLSVGLTVWGYLGYLYFFEQTLLKLIYHQFGIGRWISYFKTI